MRFLLDQPGTAGRVFYFLFHARQNGHRAPILLSVPCFECLRWYYVLSSLVFINRCLQSRYFFTLSAKRNYLSEFVAS